MTPTGRSLLVLGTLIVAELAAPGTCRKLLATIEAARSTPRRRDAMETRRRADGVYEVVP